MADEPVISATEQPKTYGGSIDRLVKSLINGLIKDSKDTYGDTPLEQIRNRINFESSEHTMRSIGALSTYMQAQASERQAAALESLAKTANKWEMVSSVETTGQAIVDQRESKREYLSTTYSFSLETLSLLWAIRGLLMDASVKSLSKPDRFDPYRRLSTEEIGWSLRISPEELWTRLPHHGDGIDFELLEEFDILHYNNDDVRPDEWMFGG